MDDLTTPDLTDVTVDDNAEPPNAEVLHHASVEEVGGLDEQDEAPKTTPKRRKNA